MCLSVTLPIVDLWQYYVCCTRSGVTCCTLFMVLFLCRMCRWGYTRRCDRTSVHLCVSSLQNLAVWQDFYSLFSISVNDLIDPLFDLVGLTGFKRRANALFWPSCSLPFSLLLFYLSLLSFYGLVLWGWGLRTDRVLIALSQPCITNRF